MKLYHHKTIGGAEYLCSSPVKGTQEGSFNSKYIVRIDGDITKDAELMVRDDTLHQIMDSIRELRDAHECSNEKNEELECTCHKYDDVIEAIRRINK